MKEIKSLDSNAEFRIWGGDLMEAQGGMLIKHYRDLAFMGFLEVLKNIRTIAKNLKFCKIDIEEYQPDAVIFIDYPGFNLRIAEHVKQLGIPTLYYISPQVWAWKQSRVKKIKLIIDKMYVILPFEKEFYAGFNYDVEFVGHPLIDAIANFQSTADRKVAFKEKYHLDERPIIALLPGSRKQEITKMLSVMLSVVDQFKDYEFVIAGAPSQSFDFYKAIIGSKNISFVNNKTYDLLSLSNAALVASGTATLETALFKVPQVVCYKGSNISYQIAKRIITLKFISLVNLIMDREVVKELIQNDFNSDLSKYRIIADSITTQDIAGGSSIMTMPKAYDFHALGMFCKFDVYLDKGSKIPLRFRLGTVGGVDELERKGPTRYNY